MSNIKVMKGFIDVLIMIALSDILKDPEKNIKKKNKMVYE